MVNKFTYVRIPKNREYFERFGNVTPMNNMYTGDELMPEQKTKVDEIADYEAYDKMMQEEEYNKSEK